jgi:antirestriction protein ArdC
MRVSISAHYHGGPVNVSIGRQYVCVKFGHTLDVFFDSLAQFNTWSRLVREAIDEAEIAEANASALADAIEDVDNSEHAQAERR